MNIIFWTTLGLILLGSIVFLAISNWKMYKRRADLNSMIDSYKEQIGNLQKENEGLNSNLSQGGSEEFFEKEARERLDLKKPGENVVVVVPPKENTEAKQESPKNFWQKIWEGIRSLWE